MVADLNDIETSFYTDELDTVYDQDTQGRWKIGEDKRMFVGP